MKRSTRIALGLLGAAFWLFTLVPPAIAEKVTFCSSWIIYGRDAFIVSGVKNGAWKSEGIDLNFVRGFGSGNSLKFAAAGKCDYAEAGAGPGAMARIRGLKAKLFMMKSAKFLETSYYFHDAGIKTWKDLEGKTITGGPKTSSDILMWPPFAKVHGIDTSKVKVLHMSPGTKAAALGAGSVDMVISYHSSIAGYQKAADQKGKKLVVKLWAENGMDIYNSGLVSSEKRLATQKDVTLRFLRGYYKSLAWGFKNREAAAAIYFKAHPATTQAIVLQAQSISFRHLFDKNTHKIGFGRMDRQKMNKTIKIVLAASGVEKKLDPSELYTNEFVDRVPKSLRFFHIR